MNTALPDPFLFLDGRTRVSVRNWPHRREEISRIVVQTEYGGLPLFSGRTQWEELHTASRISIRVTAGASDYPISFLLMLLVPPGSGPFPVVLTGDACWRSVNDKVAEEVLSRGYILAAFNRVEIAADNGRTDREAGLYRAVPKSAFGALAAWAWGYHRCLDVLSCLSYVDAGRIAVTGHSRGGKAALLAGASDVRIALTCANNSGCGGAGCFRIQGPGSETLTDILRVFPYWFGGDLKQFSGRESLLPFDQHFLKALVAPRALLTTEALGDLWANPQGTWRTHLAAKEVYRFLGAEEQIGVRFREGGHDHNLADWKAMLDFMAWRLQGKEPGYSFTESPFSSVPPVFTPAPAR